MYLSTINNASELYHMFGKYTQSIQSIRNVAKIHLIFASETKISSYMQCNCVIVIIFICCVNIIKMQNHIFVCTLTEK